MSTWSAKRKRRILIIVGLVLLLLVFLVALRVQNSKQPTCFDGLQNGQETGIDCGGACAKVCVEEVNNMVVWWERPFKVAPGVYNVVAYVENQNLYSGIEELAYEFRLYDENNILVAEPVRGTTFLEANKRSAIFASGINTGDSDAYTVFFHTNAIQDWRRVPQEYSYNLFQISEPTLTNQTTSPKLSAKVRNESFINFEDVPVVAILYNNEGNAIAASRTYIDDLPQGVEVQVFYSWPEPFGDSVSRIEIIPRVNPFIERELVTS
ncbi:hypothetical protein KC929_01385 [Patescibacteria group bacterium]|nr:hypothetical protein [Patescibacteria group bacterium]